jgi:hypothetical protein
MTDEKPMPPTSETYGSSAPGGGRPDVNSPEYQAMDRMAKLMEHRVDVLQGKIADEVEGKLESETPA